MKVRLVTCAFLSNGRSHAPGNTPVSFRSVFITIFKKNKVMQLLKLTMLVFCKLCNSTMLLTGVGCQRASAHVEILQALLTCV